MPLSRRESTRHAATNPRSAGMLDEPVALLNTRRRTSSRNEPRKTHELTLGRGADLPRPRLVATLTGVVAALVDVTAWE